MQNDRATMKEQREEKPMAGHNLDSDLKIWTLELILDTRLEICHSTRYSTSRLDLISHVIQSELLRVSP